ncbi:MAG: hypothetical protein IPM08_14235 [Actinomycetales bacterium]|nr:hypothetical protein [Actinomycetales bacterium]
MSWETIPGNPDVIQAEASKMSTTADQLDHAVRVLNKVSCGEYQSLATDAVKDSANTLSATLTKVSARYRGAGVALENFGRALRPLQDQANGAITAASHVDVEGAAKAVRAAQADEQMLIFEVDNADSDSVRKRARDAESHLTSIQHQWSNAKADYDVAYRDWNELARKTAQSISSTNETSQLNRTGKDSTLNWWHDVLDNLGTVLTIASILLCWVPGLGQILLIAVALVALAALVVSIVQASNGEKSWGEVFIEGAFAVLSVIGAVKAVRLLGKARVFRLQGARLRNVFKPSQFPKWKAKWFVNASRRISKSEKSVFQNFFLKEHSMLGSGKKLIRSGVINKTTFKVVNDMSEFIISKGIQKGIDRTIDYLKTEQTDSPSAAGCSQYSSSMAAAR